MFFRTLKETFVESKPIQLGQEFPIFGGHIYPPFHMLQRALGPRGRIPAPSRFLEIDGITLKTKLAVGDMNKRDAALSFGQDNPLGNMRHVYPVFSAQGSEGLETSPFVFKRPELKAEYFENPSLFGTRRVEMTVSDMLLTCPPDTGEKLSRIRFQLIFKDGQVFESPILYSTDLSLVLYTFPFGNFRPISDRKDPNADCIIWLPRDKKILSQLRGRFILDEDYHEQTQPKEN